MNHLEMQLLAYYEATRDSFMPTQSWTNIMPLVQTLEFAFNPETSFLHVNKESACRRSLDPFLRNSCVPPSRQCFPPIPYHCHKNNSWSNIVHAFTEKKRIRPMSAPNTRQAKMTQDSSIAIDNDTITNNNNSNRYNRNTRVASARARLIDVATRKDEPTAAFERSEEIQAVVEILQNSRTVRSAHWLAKK